MFVCVYIYKGTSSPDFSLNSLHRIIRCLMLTKHHRVHFHDSIVHNVCQHSQLVLKKEKKKPGGLLHFLPLHLSISAPPSPLHHHSPFSLLHPCPVPSSSSYIPPGCPETLHYCRHGNTSTIWQWSWTLLPTHPSSFPDSFSPSVLIFYAFPSSHPPSAKVPPAPLKTWLPDKNHQITAASGAYDDGTTPWGFPSTPTTP